MPGFDQVLLAVADAWQNRREQADRAGRRADRASAGRGSRRTSGERARRRAAATGRGARSSGSFDRQHGGFGSAPKFPHPMDLRLLLRRLAARPARDALLRHGHAHARQDGGRRHLRSPRRRLRSLLGRRALARAALRKDALRQRAARPALSRSLSRRPATPTTPASPARRSTTCSAR